MPVSTEPRVHRDGLAEIDDYQEMLEQLESMIDEGVEKIESGRIYDEEKERVRVSWLRATAKCIDVWRKLKTDSDLEELRYEVERLKANRNQ